MLYILHKSFQEDNPYPNHNHNHNRKTKSAEHPHLSVIGHQGAKVIDHSITNSYSIIKKSKNLPNDNVAKFDNGSATNMTNRQPASNDHVETVNYESKEMSIDDNNLILRK